MSRPTAFLILLVCAILEAGGDAIIRRGLHTPALWTRTGLFLTGAVVLFAYGWLVNRPPWSFGSLLGIYVALFYVVAQAIGFFAFHERPTPGILIGGALIVSGAVVVTVMR